MQQQVAYVYEVFKMSHHMALVVLGISKRSFTKGFQNFQINFPRTQTFGVKIISSDHIANINYLDEHEFPKNICSQASR
jgi:hypothetical protein